MARDKSDARFIWRLRWVSLLIGVPLSLLISAATTDVEPTWLRPAFAWGFLAAWIVGATTLVSRMEP